MTILNKIQTELKAPKNQRNNFGKFNYRSCEDILEALKPLLKKYEATLIINDDIINIGNRYYIKATVTIKTADGEETATAFAREEETRKGMDAAQITGSASSYARKYALNGLFAIDDTKDADTRDNSDTADIKTKLASANTEEELKNAANELLRTFPKKEIMGFYNARLAEIKGAQK